MRVVDGQSSTASPRMVFSSSDTEPGSESLLTQKMQDSSLTGTPAPIMCDEAPRAQQTPGHGLEQ